MHKLLNLAYGRSLFHFSILFSSPITISTNGEVHLNGVHVNEDAT